MSKYYTLEALDNQHLAKKMGYMWKPLTGQWLKKILVEYLELEKKQATFPIKVLELGKTFTPSLI